MPQSAPFAMGKFALRGLAQSMARELHPQGIHVAHVVIDGGIKSERRTEPPGKTASLLEPELDRRELSASHPSAAQRVVVGARAAAVGGEILTAIRGTRFRLAPNSSTFQDRRNRNHDRIAAFSFGDREGRNPEENPMRNTLMAAVAVAALMVPSIASADPNAAGGAAAGAAVGAGTGFIVGGPVGAAIGAGVGGTVGAGTAPRDRAAR